MRESIGCVDVIVLGSAGDPWWSECVQVLRNRSR